MIACSLRAYRMAFFQSVKKTLSCSVISVKSAILTFSSYLSIYARSSSLPSSSLSGLSCLKTSYELKDCLRCLTAFLLNLAAVRFRISWTRAINPAAKTCFSLWSKWIFSAMLPSQVLLSSSLKVQNELVLAHLYLPTSISPKWCSSYLLDELEI